MESVVLQESDRDKQLKEKSMGEQRDRQWLYLIAPRASEKRVT